MTAPTPRLSLAAQYVACLLEFVPLSALKHPGSRIFRAALADGIRRSGLALHPSRREVARAITELDVAGRLTSIIAARSGSASFYRDNLDVDDDPDEWDTDDELDSDTWELES